MKYVTIDPYYDLKFYNETLDALRNNNIKFTECISIKTPNNWYIGVDETNLPKFINFDLCSKTEERFLISKVRPCIPADEIKLYRRHKGKTIEPYITNDAFKSSTGYLCLFDLKNKIDGYELSRKIGRFYYLGKYYSNKYRVCITDNPNIKNFIPLDNILMESTNAETKETLRMECDFNYKVLFNKERIQKFTLTPYFENGIYELPTIQIQDKNKFFTL